MYKLHDIISIAPSMDIRNVHDIMNFVALVLWEFHPENENLLTISVALRLRDFTYDLKQCSNFFEWWIVIRNFQLFGHAVKLSCRPFWTDSYTSTLSFRAVLFNLGSIAIFLGVTRASDNVHNFFYIFISYMESLFVVGKMIGSPGKNDCLLLHSKLLYVWLWPMQSFECDYDLYTTVAFGNARINLWR